MGSLYQYQLEGVERLYNIVTGNREAAAMLCDPPGAGKTPQAIGLFKKLNAKTMLIVCPAVMRETWKREICIWYNRPLKIMVMETAKDPIPMDIDVLITSFSLAEKMHERFLFRIWDLLVVDESHYLKNPAGNTARAILVPIWAVCRYKLLMTGTPLPNGRAAEAYTTFARCSEADFGSWSDFKDRYCIEEMTRYGPRYLKSRNLGLLKQKAERFMVRRPKEEVMAQLPDLIRQNIYVNLPQFNIFKEEQLLDTEEILRLVDQGLPIEGEPVSLYRMKLGQLKTSYIFDQIVETLDEVERVVVFVHHRAVFAALEDLLRENEISFVSIAGLTPQPDRVKNVDKFQKGEVQVFLASLRTANTGLTLTVASTLIMGEYDWVPSTNTQAEGRIHRVSQKEICRVKYIVAAGTLDEKVLAVLQDKQRSIKQALV
jgi:SNF2 family DNA or RNA helicase